jgi:hypothetical protein
MHRRGINSCSFRYFIYIVVLSILDSMLALPIFSKVISRSNFISFRFAHALERTVGNEARSCCIVRLSPPVPSVLIFSADSKTLVTLGYDGMV